MKKTTTPSVLAAPYSMAFSLPKTKSESRYAILSRCMPILGFRNDWRQTITPASVSGMRKEVLLNWAGPRGLIWSRETNHHHSHTELINNKTISNHYSVNNIANNDGSDLGKNKTTIQETNPIDHKKRSSKPDREERPKPIQKRTTGVGPNGTIDLPLTFNIAGKRSKAINNEQQARVSSLIMPFMRMSFRRKALVNSQRPILRNTIDESDGLNLNLPTTKLQEQPHVLPGKQNQQNIDRNSESNWPGPFKKRMENTMNRISESVQDKVEQKVKESVKRHVKQIKKDLSVELTTSTKVIKAKEIVTDDVVRLIMQKAHSFMEKERFRLGILK